MKDEDLRSQRDYSEGQREAAHRVLIEVTNILRDYQNDILLIGGWVPDLLFPGKDHIGSIDVDILLNHKNLVEASYATIRRMLLNSDYRLHSEKSFSFIRKVSIEGQEYDVDLDILAGKYGGTNTEKSSQHIQGVKALKATGGNFAFEVPASEVVVQARRPDGAKDSAHVRVVSLVAFLVMKAAALGRSKNKDAYDIYFCVKNWPDGIDALAKCFEPVRTHGLVREMCEILKEKFASPEHAGPRDVVAFLDIHDEEESEQLRRDAYERINQFLESI